MQIPNNLDEIMNHSGTVGFKIGDIVSVASISYSTPGRVMKTKGKWIKILKCHYSSHAERVCGEYHEDLVRHATDSEKKLWVALNKKICDPLDWYGGGGCGCGVCTDEWQWEEEGKDV